MAKKTLTALNDEFSMDIPRGKNGAVVVQVLPGGDATKVIEIQGSANGVNFKRMGIIDAGDPSVILANLTGPDIMGWVEVISLQKVRGIVVNAGGGTNSVLWMGFQEG